MTGAAVERGDVADDRFRVVPASYVVFRRRSAAGGEQVLLQLRRNTGYMDGHWASAAAGHVEAGESAIAAARREAAEELGVDVAEADLVPLLAMHRTQGTTCSIDERVDFFFACRRWSGEPRIVEPHKNARLEWFDLDALPTPVVPHELHVLTGLRGDAHPAIVTYGFAAG